MNKQKKKKSGFGVWAVIAAVVLILNNLDALDGIDSWQIQRFFFRLRHNPTLLAAILTGVITLVIVLISLAAGKRRAAANAERAASRSFTPHSAPYPAAKRGASDGAQHSHDRVQGYVGGESGYDHWKKQLDGFLAAGIIDRKEYAALLERRRDSYPE